MQRPARKGLLRSKTVDSFESFSIVKWSHTVAKLVSLPFLLHLTIPFTCDLLVLLMPERDYAAPLRQERRESIFSKLRPSSIWGRKPALTPDLRENFLDLSRSHLPSDAIPPVPTIPDAFQTDRRSAGANEQHHSRTDSAQGLRPIARAGRYYQQSEFRPEYRPSSQERNDRQPKTEQTAATAYLLPVHSRSPDWSYERPRAAPSTTARTPPPTYQEHLNSTQRRDGNGRLFQIPNTPHFPTIEQAVRRQRRQPSLRDQASHYNSTQTPGSPSIIATNRTTTRSAAARSLLRNEVPRGNDLYSVESSISHGNTRTTITANCNTTTGHDGDSRFSNYPSPAKAHTLPRISHSSFTALPASSTNPQTQLSQHSFRGRIQTTYDPNSAELQATPSSPADTSLSLSEIHEAEDSLTPLPVPTVPYSHHPSTNRTGSTNSVATSAATLGNRSSASRPLTFIEANFVGFANVVGFKPDQRKSRTERRSWTAKLVKYGKKTKTKAQQLWIAQSRQRKILRCKIDVLWTGPLRDCRCDVCTASLGLPSAGVRRYHEVPKGFWVNTTLEDYHKLNWGEDANPCTWDSDAPATGLGAFRVGPRCEEVKYVTTRVDLDE